jgi:hypothetical protein
MAITESYVDPAINAASGAGTVGDPWGDLQHALDTMTRDGTNGDRINIKAGTDEVLTAALDLSTYGTPSQTAPLIIQGYTTAAEDGGIGGISGNGTYATFDSTAIDYTGIIDMHVHNSGSARPLKLRNEIYLENVEIDNTTTDGVFAVGVNWVIHNCYFHNCGDAGVSLASYGERITACYFEDGANTFNFAIETSPNSTGSIISNNIINLTGNGDGIRHAGLGIVISNNTVYSAGGTGTGIDIISGVDRLQMINNNYVEGFSGVGGVGIAQASGSGDILLMTANRYYNNTSNESLSGAYINKSDNSAVGSSALTNPGGGDFSVGTDLKAGAYPTTFKGVATDQFMDIGAAQREEPAGGGGTTGRQGLHAIEAGAV